MVVILLYIFYTTFYAERFILFEEPKKYFTAQKKKLNIVIPIRDRESQLKEIVKQFDKILNHQFVDYRIYIIEQSKNKLFNRGKLLNIGFIESQKDDFSDHYLFQDVDIYPQTRTFLDYRPVQGKIRHPYGDRHSFGCFVFMDKDIYEKINGHSNDFWGWGSEDVDIKIRAELHGIEIDDANLIPRYSTSYMNDAPGGSTINQTGEKNDKLREAKELCYKKNINTIQKDGIRNCDYKIVKRYNYQNNPKLIRFVVDV